MEKTEKTEKKKSVQFWFEPEELQRLDSLVKASKKKRATYIKDLLLKRASEGEGIRIKLEHGDVDRIRETVEHVPLGTQERVMWAALQIGMETLRDMKAYDAALKVRDLEKTHEAKFI